MEKPDPIRQKFLHKSYQIFVQIPFLLDSIQSNLFKSAENFRDSNTYSCTTYDEFKALVKKGGFIRCGWDGRKETEDRIKKETKATIRCIPFDQKNTDQLKCVYTGKSAKYEVIFSKAY